MIPTTRFLGTTLLILTLTGTVAAAPAQTPEQRVAARKMSVYNGPTLTVHYKVDDLNPVEALAYRRLEYLENQAAMENEQQQFGRLQIQRNLQYEMLRRPTWGPAFPTVNGCYPSDPATQAMQTFGDLAQAYQDVLTIERAHLGLPGR